MTFGHSTYIPFISYEDLLISFLLLHPQHHIFTIEFSKGWSLLHKISQCRVLSLEFLPLFYNTYLFLSEEMSHRANLHVLFINLD